MNLFTPLVAEEKLHPNCRIIRDAIKNQTTRIVMRRIFQTRPSYMTCFVENNLSNIVFSLICGSINFHGNGMVVIFIQPRFADYVFARQVVPQNINVR